MRHKRCVSNQVGRVDEARHLDHALLFGQISDEIQWPVGGALRIDPTPLRRWAAWSRRQKCPTKSIDTTPSNREGVFEFSLPFELDFFTQVNTEGWQFILKWKGFLADNIDVYELETHSKAEVKRSAAELYPHQRRTEAQTSTDAPAENCRVQLYSSSVDKSDGTKANGMLSCLVRIDVSVGTCDAESLCRLDFSDGGQLCGDVDVSSPFLGGQHSNNQRLHYVVSPSRYEKACNSEVCGLKVAAYSEQIQKALSSK